MLTSIKDVFTVLGKYKFPLTDEKKLQELIEKAFITNGLQFEREKRLDNKDIIDFFMSNEGVGIEVKVKKKASAFAIYRQLERYAKHPELSAIILVTGRAMGLPEQIKGKPIYYFHLSANAL